MSFKLPNSMYGRMFEPGWQGASVQKSTDVICTVPQVNPFKGLSWDECSRRSRLTYFFSADISYGSMFSPGSPATLSVRPI